MEEGEDGLIAKNGNPYSALHTSKSLSEIDRLRVAVLKQEIEIERLKKGYWVEGTGANKVYVTGGGVILKSSPQRKIFCKITVRGAGRQRLRILQMAL